MLRVKAMALITPFMVAGLALGLLGQLLHPQAVQALICNVPATYATIQAAVTDTSCTVVNVGAGTFSENVVVSRTIIIRGQSQPSTRVDGNGQGSVFTVQSGHLVTITNMTVANGDAVNGGGIANAGSAVVLDQVAIVSNTADSGAGLYNDGGVVIVNQSRVSNNGASAGPGGIANSNGGRITISHSTVASNTAGFGTGGIQNLDGQVVLIDSSVSGNSAFGIFGFGGGIRNFNGQVQVISSTLSHNSADRLGGGVFNQIGTTSLVASAVMSNRATTGGGGLYNDNGTVRLERSLVMSNTAGGGGGIYNVGISSLSRMTLVSSTVSGNVADSEGGGLYNESSLISVSVSTVSHNRAAFDGGGLYNRDGGTATFRSSTVHNNSAEDGGGLYNVSGLVTLANTIVANSVSGDDCDGAAFQTSNPNLDSDGSCGASITADPLLEPLAVGNGAGLIYALQSGSRAIDAGVCLPGLPTDQRGVPRPVGSACDIGAYEATYPLSLRKTADDATPQPGQQITYTVIVENKTPVTMANVLVSDTLPGGVSFVGPITLGPAGVGTAGNTPPVLASNAVLSSGRRLTITFPVLIDTGQAAGIAITNTAHVTASGIQTPIPGTGIVTVDNAPPVAVADEYRTPVDVPLFVPAVAGVLANDEDANDDSLAVVAGPSDEVVSLLIDGSFTYSPAPGFTGYDTFTYTVSDGALTDTAVTTVKVTDFPFSRFFPAIFR